MKEDTNLLYGGSMRPGQDLVAAGYIALKGTVLLAVLGEPELKTRFTAQFVRRCQRVYENAQAVRTFMEAGEEVLGATGAESFCMAGEGGVMAALWDYFDAYGLGFEMELRKLPLLQETVEVCEVFDVNPYRLRSEGCVLLTAANGGALVRKLKKQGIPAVVIGRTAKGIGRKINNGGIQTFLDKPKPDELYKIQLTGGKL